MLRPHIEDHLVVFEVLGLEGVRGIGLEVLVNACGGHYLVLARSSISAPGPHPRRCRSGTRFARPALRLMAVLASGPVAMLTIGIVLRHLSRTDPRRGSPLPRRAGRTVFPASPRSRATPRATPSPCAADDRPSRRGGKCGADRCGRRTRRRRGRRPRARASWPWARSSLPWGSSDRREEDTP